MGLPTEMTGNLRGTGAARHHGHSPATHCVHAKAPLGAPPAPLRAKAVASVVGVLTAVGSCRQCLLQGKDRVSGEWRLVRLAWNVNPRWACGTNAPSAGAMG
jgi:hypothetical protein